MVVFPALSRPNIRIRTSLEPNSDWKRRLKNIPILCRCTGRCSVRLAAVTRDMESDNSVSNHAPGYLRQTVSSITTSSCSSESERIAKSFRGGSFYSIKKLPARLLPGVIDESRKLNIAESLSNKPLATYKARTVPVYFTPITYSRTEYNKLAENEREEAQFQRLTTLSFSRKPFTYSSSKVRLKNEDIFGNEEYKYPILGPGKGVSELSTFVRQDFTNAEKMIHGPFFVLGKGRDREAARDDIYSWCREIYEKISTDWSHLRYHMQVLEGQEIVVLFEMNTLRGDSDGSGSYAEVALSRFMGTMSRHGVAAERRLRKRGDRWRVLEWMEVKPTPGATPPRDSIESGSDTASSVMVEVVVYSFFAPWVTSAQNKAHRHAAKTNRRHTRDCVRTQNEKYGDVRLAGTTKDSQSLPVSDNVTSLPSADRLDSSRS
jgi:hypothetical protein